MRLGLKLVTRRGWAPEGQRPVARVRRRYEWLYVYGFVRPSTGEAHWLILPTVYVEVFSLALSQFAKQVGASKERRILLVLDQARRHTGVRRSRFRKGYTLSSCHRARPRCSPSRKAVALDQRGDSHRLLESFEELEEALVERCAALFEQVELIRSHTHYHWWPDAA
jgi:hypothetical protein